MWYCCLGKFKQYNWSISAPKKDDRIMMAVSSRCSCKGLLKKKLDVLPGTIEIYVFIDDVYC